jgi:hypothetical protein
MIEVERKGENALGHDDGRMWAQRMANSARRSHWRSTSTDPRSESALCEYSYIGLSMTVEWMIPVGPDAFHPVTRGNDVEGAIQIEDTLRKFA